MSKNTLKLYVWEDVLRDYSAGMVCILAHDLEEALEVARQKFESHIIEGFAGHPYQVITEPDAFYVYGGG
jgi:hypothetical protein